MTHEITYNGLSAVPSDRDCPDGALAQSLNVIHEDDALQPLFQPKTELQLEDGEHLWCRHVTSLIDHYITTDSAGALYWRDMKAEDHTMQDIGTTVPGITGITCIGNTLCVLNPSGVHYFLWDNERNSGVGNYTYLSDHFPDVTISFGLQGEMRKRNVDSMTVYCVDDDISQIPPILTSDSRDILTEKVNAAVNKLLSDVTTEGRFCMPFFLRYALRLYDGTITNQSAPILMLPSTKGAPYVQCMSMPVEGYALHPECTASVIACKLDAACVSDTSSLAQFSDIIKSVDIFVSYPLYTYDTNMQCKLDTWDRDYDWGIYSLKGIYDFYNSIGRGDVATKLGGYSKRTINDSYRQKYGEFGIFLVKMPSKPNSELDNLFNSSSVFYHAKSIAIDDLSAERTIIDIDRGILNSLTSREVMQDDYDSHCQKVATNAFSYNSRLILSGVSKSLFNGYFSVPFADSYLYPANDPDHPSVSIGYSPHQDQDGIVRYYANKWIDVGHDDDEDKLYKVIKVFTHTKHEGIAYTSEEDVHSVKDGVVVDYIDMSAGVPGYSFTEGSLTFELLPSDLCFPFLYHPDNSAFQVDIILKRDVGTTTEYFKVQVMMKKHDTLNGAYYFQDFFYSEPEPIQQSDIPSPSSNRFFPVLNQLYVSEVNNPFVFPATGIVTVGTGEILGVSAAAQALSQGQFGSFPLYAFTTDGIWALRVSDTGTFSAVQPISRDVCISKDGILQLDNSVLFATERGVMMLAGSQVTCVSDAIFSEKKCTVSDLPQYSQLLNIALDTSVSAEQYTPAPLTEFLPGSLMVYDYLHQHIVIFNPTTDASGNRKYSFALVLSKKSGLWGMMSSNLAYPINSYPEAIAVTTEGKVVSFAGTSDTYSSGLFITRPIKCGAADTLKTLRSLYHRGMFRRGDVFAAVYGSRDLFTWHLIASGRTDIVTRISGTPYKYFRIAGITRLQKGKSVTGATIDLSPKQTRRLH